MMDTSASPGRPRPLTRDGRCSSSSSHSDRKSWLRVGDAMPDLAALQHLALRPLDSQDQAPQQPSHTRSTHPGVVTCRSVERAPGSWQSGGGAEGEIPHHHSSSLPGFMRSSSHRLSRKGIHESWLHVGDAMPALDVLAGLCGWGGGGHSVCV